MKKIVLYIILLISTHLALGQQNTWQYYFDKPASIWEETIPLGNGRIGFMPWGGIDEERIVLNEISLWAGQKQQADNPEAYSYLPEIRNLLFQKKNKEAEELMYETFTCLGKGSGDITNYGNYQNFANLHIKSIYDKNETLSYFRRELDMNNAISRTLYTRGEVTYKREYFTSFADDIGVIRYSTNKEKALSLDVSLNRDENYWSQAEENTLIIGGQMPSANPYGGLIFYGKVKIKNIGGTITIKDKNIIIRNADEVLFFVSMATNYDNTSAKQKVITSLNQIDQTDYNRLKERHSETYKKLFDRVDLTLDKNKNSDLPIDKRLEAFSTDKTDYNLIALYMQYGRYLLISSTRAGGLPPNLQGLWAHQIMTPWNGDYHLNINLQMNFWPAESGNLSELHTTLVNYVQNLVPAGEKTAKIYYNSSGWVTHILGNIWQFTSPSEDPSWGATNTANAWLCQHLWQHYEYTLDKEYLKVVYPIMKGASAFFNDMLIENPNNGYLVTAPTTSPENKYISESGDTLSIVAGSTMDNQLIRELFTNTITATDLLNCDKDFAQLLNKKLKRLAPTSIGKYGQVKEWIEDYEEAEPHHRHISQLYGLFPGNEITYEKTPQLMEAAKVTLNRRGDMSTGWSVAWKINFWARLKDGNRAYKLIGDLLTPAKNHAGTYPNLFSAHPPMQIDGNFGGSAGIMEMLVQSHAGYIELLPAIPEEWTNGKIRGIKVRGGAEVGFIWKNKEINQIDFQTSTPHEFIIKSLKKPRKILGIQSYDYFDQKIRINVTEPNQRIKIYY
ncbi:MAG: glycoside hydrolase family 95 protein [Clostridiales bacterium]|nr:glycoside hydrolase family 95 protein [Clostridiales bacterium]